MNHTGHLPPRSLPLLSKLIILFGGFYAQFGWIFFTMGMLFFWIFFIPSGGHALLTGEGIQAFDWTILLVAIFPLVGLGFIYFGMRNNLKSLELMLNGHLATGIQKSKSITNTRINDQPVYRYVFEFEAADGQTYEVTGNTHLPHLLEGEKYERILYAYGDPVYARLYDLVPHAPNLNADGRLEPIPALRAVVLLLPLIALLMHAWLLFPKWFI